MTQQYFGIPSKPPSYTKYSSGAQGQNHFVQTTSANMNNSFSSLMHSSAQQTNTLGNAPISQSLPNNGNAINFLGGRSTLQNSINPSNQGISVAQQMNDRLPQSLVNLPRSNSPQSGSNRYLSSVGQNVFGGYTSNRLLPNTTLNSPNNSPNYPKSLNIKLISDNNVGQPNKMFVKCIAATQENVSSHKTKEMLRIQNYFAQRGLPMPNSINNTGFSSSNTPSPFQSSNQGLGHIFNQQQQSTNNSFGMKNGVFGGTTNNTSAMLSSQNQTSFLSGNTNNQTNSPFIFGQTNNNAFNQNQQQQSPFSQFPQSNQQQNQLFQQNNPFNQNTPFNQNSQSQQHFPNQAYSNINYDLIAYNQYINDLYHRTIHEKTCYDQFFKYMQFMYSPNSRSHLQRQLMSFHPDFLLDLVRKNNFILSVQKEKERIERENSLFGLKQGFSKNGFGEDDFRFDEYYDDYMDMNIGEIFKGDMELKKKLRQNPSLLQKIMDNKDNLTEYFNRRAESAMRSKDQPFYYELDKKKERQRSKHKGAIPLTKEEQCKDVFVPYDPQNYWKVSAKKRPFEYDLFEEEQKEKNCKKYVREEDPEISVTFVQRDHKGRYVYQKKMKGKDYPRDY